MVGPTIWTNSQAALPKNISESKRYLQSHFLISCNAFRFETISQGLGFSVEGTSRSNTQRWRCRRRPASWMVLMWIPGERILRKVQPKLWRERQVRTTKTRKTVETYAGDTEHVGCLRSTSLESWLPRLYFPLLRSG